MRLPNVKGNIYSQSREPMHHGKAKDQCHRDHAGQVENAPLWRGSKNADVYETRRAAEQTNPEYLASQ